MFDNFPIITFVLVLFDIYVLVTLRQIEQGLIDCKCAETWHLKKLTKTMTFILLMHIVSMIFHQAIKENQQLALEGKGTFLITLINIPFLIAYFVNLYDIYVLFDYVMYLDKSKCICIGKPMNNLLYYYGVFRLGMIVLALFLVMVFMTVSVFSK